MLDYMLLLLLRHLAVVPCYALLLRGRAPCHRAQFHALSCYGTLLSCPLHVHALRQAPCHRAQFHALSCYGTLLSCPLHVHALRQAPCHRAHYLALIFRCDTLLSCPVTCSCVTIKHLALVLTSMLLPFGNGTILSCPFCVLSL